MSTNLTATVTEKRRQADEVADQLLAAEAILAGEIEQHGEFSREAFAARADVDGWVRALELADRIADHVAGVAASWAAYD